MGRSKAGDRMVQSLFSPTPAHGHRCRQGPWRLSARITCGLSGRLGLPHHMEGGSPGRAQRGSREEARVPVLTQAGGVTGASLLPQAPGSYTGLPGSPPSEATSPLPSKVRVSQAGWVPPTPHREMPPSPAPRADLGPGGTVQSFLQPGLPLPVPTVLQGADLTPIPSDPGRELGHLQRGCRPELSLREAA